MKQKFNHILVTVLAAIVFFVGMGVNVFDLCCSNCAENLLSADSHINNLCVASPPTKQIDDCCSHQEEALPQTDDCSTHHQDKDKHCSIERVSADIQYSQIKTSVITPFIWTLVSNNTTLFDSENILLNKFEQSYKTPIPIPPRDYLSFIRILII